MLISPATCHSRKEGGGIVPANELEKKNFYVMAGLFFVAVVTIIAGNIGTSIVNRHMFTQPDATRTQQDDIKASLDELKIDIAVLSSQYTADRQLLVRLDSAIERQWRDLGDIKRQAEINSREIEQLKERASLYGPSVKSK